ncbi:MAG: hypothetical protein KDA21_10065 [Phycisphaerales bacterium]|nr:hypothetical protein [Phycisphaerales bacterium]
MKNTATSVILLLAAAGLSVSLVGCDQGGEKADQPAATGDTSNAAATHADDHAGHDHGDADHDHDHDHADDQADATHDHEDAADHAAAGGGARNSGNLPVNIGGAVFAANGALMVFPPTWEMVPVTSSLATAKRQYTIPGDAGEGSATVYVGSMGPPEMNIKRWTDQIVDPDEEITRRQHVGPIFQVTEIIGHGSVATTMGGAPEPDQTLMALLITGGGQGDMYVKAVGPRATMEQYNDGWQQLIDSIIRSGG